MAKHHPDLIFCRKQAGVAIGRLCEKCDGKCVICDSYVRPCTLVRICDECNYGSYQGRCVICGGPGVSDAYYCKECTIQEKDTLRLCTETLSQGELPKLALLCPWVSFCSQICYLEKTKDVTLFLEIHVESSTESCVSPGSLGRKALKLERRPQGADRV
ncbi:PHD finger-like domain-containing protein 5A isoform X1 [Petaurus breviceps papuanus]|uniref:PHD finger-like domain-containing protein 5A isoform X1 n=1 Tax=Petaurus breviceps papuanus TaxID=3040969 RepID=UPI0036DD37CD